MRRKGTASVRGGRAARRLAAVAAAAAALALLLAAVLAAGGCRPGAAVAEPRVAAEEVPEGVGLLHVSATYEELLEKAKPDLAWIDDPGPNAARLLLWVKGSWAKPDEYRGTFTMARAYRFARSGKPFWALLGAARDWPARRGSYAEIPPSVLDFSVQKCVREELVCPIPYHPDGTHNFVELLARNDEGAAVFKIVYCSLGTSQPHNEDVRVYLVYMAPDGALRLAASGLPEESGRSLGGSTGVNYACDMRVVWTPESREAPFRVELRTRAYWYVVTAYEACRDGTLSGAFPLKLRLGEERYVEGDGKLTLNALADRLIGVHSEWIANWIHEGWAKPEDKELVTSQWRSELQRLNPGLNPATAIPQGQRIVIPETSGFGDRVYDRVYKAAHERSRKREAK